MNEQMICKGRNKWAELSTEQSQIGSFTESMFKWNLAKWLIVNTSSKYMYCGILECLEEAASLTMPLERQQVIYISQMREQFCDRLEYIRFLPYH